MDDLLVIIGTPIRLQRGPTTQVRKIKEIKMQPNFEFSHSQEIADYDVALVVLFQAIEIDRLSADIIPLTKRPPRRDMPCTVIGWWRVYTVCIIPKISNGLKTCTSSSADSSSYGDNCE